ncbi:hypothetical protein K3495_g6097 [Podosphaera aphanis]|nr:hypothetical protein K3495_g6097 [Podosphaera aphanis]
MQNLDKKAPALMETMMSPQTHQYEALATPTKLTEDDCHGRVALIYRITEIFCVSSYGLDVFANQISVNTRLALCRAFVLDYNESVNVTGSKRLGWFKNLSFDTL